MYGIYILRPKHDIRVIRVFIVFSVVKIASIARVIRVTRVAKVVQIVKLLRGLCGAEKPCEKWGHGYGCLTNSSYSYVQGIHGESHNLTSILEPGLR